MKKTYKFYGWENANCAPQDRLYHMIENPRVLYDMMSDIWCEYSCAPRLRKDWSKKNKTLGQCSITAFLVQDIFGGQVFGVKLPDGGVHCFNVVDGVKFDLTSEQFGDEKLNYDDTPEQFRANHFADKDKFERYTYIKSQLLRKIIPLY